MDPPSNDPQPSDSGAGESTPPPALERGFFGRLVAACRRPGFYRVPLRESLRDAFGYALRLLLLLGVIWGSAAAYHNWTQLRTVVRNVKPQLPPIAFHNGVLEVEGEVPQRITLMDDRELIIDPEGTLVRDRMAPNVVAVWVNRALFVRLVPGEFYSFSTRLQRDDGEAPVVRITAQRLDEWVRGMKWIVLPLWAFLGVLGVVIEGSLLIVAISVGGLLARSRLRRPMPWSALLKICCYAATPVLLVQYTTALVGIPVPFAFSVFLGGGALWVYWLVGRLEQPQAQAPPSSSTPSDDDPFGPSAS